MLPSGLPSCIPCARLLDEEPPLSTFQSRPRFSRPMAGIVSAASQPSGTASLNAAARSSAIAMQAQRAAVSDLVTVIAPNSTIRSDPPTSKFGSTVVCPGCAIKVWLMDRDTANGPKSTRWHQRCLRCGQGRPELGCGKQLDDGATIRDTIPLCRMCSVSSDLIIFRLELIASSLAQGFRACASLKESNYHYVPTSISDHDVHVDPTTS